MEALNAVQYKPPDIAIMGKKVQVKFTVEDNRNEWFDRIATMIRPVESMEYTYFPYDKETIYLLPNVADLRLKVIDHVIRLRMFDL